MRLFRLFFIVVAALTLSACSSNFFSITPKEDREKAKQEKAKKERTAAISQPNASTSGDITAPPPINDNTSLNKPVVNNPPLPVIDPSLDVNISPQDAEKFQEWKRSRASSSNDYREFREYQDWLEFKKLNEQYK